ncbi:MAG TPA: protein phosphatase 2C domain-containing protein [Polyangia bacterium]|nr:protein phosphatase 2C domain-containing protein [Polyangia bacterium]
MIEAKENSPAPEQSDVRVALLSDKGPVRSANEDSCGHRTVPSATTLVVVADGVSGYHAADVASQMAVEVTLEAYERQDTSMRAEARLARAAQEANISIYDRSMVVPELRGMATTLTAVAISDGQLAAAHVGDSRLYLVRGNRALQLTKDHRSGKVALTRSVGRELIVAIDKITRPLEPEDVLVLCTDGLHNVISDGDIARLASDADPDGACRALVDAALAAGADDNLTVAVVRMPAGPPRPRPATFGDRLRRLVGKAR